MKSRRRYKWIIVGYLISLLLLVACNTVGSEPQVEGDNESVGNESSEVVAAATAVNTPVPTTTIAATEAAAETAVPDTPQPTIEPNPTEEAITQMNFQHNR